MSSSRSRVAIVAAALLAATLAACTTAPSTVATTVEAAHEHAEGIEPDLLGESIARDIAIVQWAVEWDLEEPFSFAELEQSYARDADERGDGAAFGAQTFTVWDHYAERVEEDAQQIQDRIKNELDISEVRAFYDENPDAFARQDEIVVDVVEWQNGRAYSEYEVRLDEANVRTWQEEDDVLVGAALNLDEGEEITVNRGDGRQVQLFSRTRSPAGSYAFDEVVQAAASMLAAERFEHELQLRISRES